MKFARYLEDNLAPEWEKAYIDYHGLKVHLGLLRAQADLQIDTSSSFGNTDPDQIHHLPQNIEVEDDESEEDLSGGITASTRMANLLASGIDPTTNSPLDQSGHGPGSAMRWRTDNHERTPSFSLAMASLPHMTGTALNAPSQQSPLPSSRSPVTHRFKNPGPLSPPPLHTILSDLPVLHAEFFDLLDTELAKVLTFYVEREKDMHERAKLLKKQFTELEVHRQIFHESSARVKAQGWVKRAGLSVSLALLSMIKWFYNTKSEEPRHADANGIVTSELRHGGHRVFAATSNLGVRVPEHVRMGGDHPGSRRRGGKTKGAAEWDLGIASSPRVLDKMPSRRHPSVPSGGAESSHDPHGYRHAKRRLRKAVAEHYRGLEILNNFRVSHVDPRSNFLVGLAANLEPSLLSVLLLNHAFGVPAFHNKILNLTGFRKVLKRYGKITKTSVLDAYMKEKVEPSALASRAMVGTLLKEMENLFATRFEHGDRKRAKDHLHVGPLSKTQDFTTFRFGLWLGLAIPAIVAGCYLSFKEYTRRTLSSWNILLLIYSVLVIPVLMALLICVNIFAWARNRINYVFIFKLNPRIRHDHQEYFELPSLLLCTLAYGFWFSMAQLGPPMLWPLLWLFLALVVMSNPFHSVLSRATRWWTIKKIAKLGASGIWNVEFIDLWLGDQFCSLVYSLSNLYVVGCIYTSSSDLSSAHDNRAQEALSMCGTTGNWGWYYALGMLPFLVRFVQSLRRYRDSKLFGQLVNAGKYGMGMIQLFFYCYWRHRAMPRTGKSYVLFCFTSTVNSLYAYAWDVAVDWSMCQPYARYPLLRRELAYKSHIPFYYLALVSDLCIRFIWLTYIVSCGTSIELRTFIAAVLEMLRRVQWNFYRVENKHLSNIEEYRVTRELPLPYHFDAHPSEEEVYIARLQLRKRLARLS